MGVARWGESPALQHPHETTVWWCVPAVLVLKGRERENPEDPASQNSVKKILRKTSHWQPHGVHLYHRACTHACHTLKDAHAGTIKKKKDNIHLKENYAVDKNDMYKSKSVGNK